MTEKMQNITSNSCKQDIQTSNSNVKLLDLALPVLKNIQQNKSP